MPTRRSGRLVLDCVQGNVANQPGTEASVNAANAQSMPGAGVARAIHRGAGPGLAEGCRPPAPLASGEAVITYGCDQPSDARRAEEPPA